MNRWNMISTVARRPHNPNRRDSSTFWASEYNMMSQFPLWLKNEIAFTIRNTKQLALGSQIKGVRLKTLPSWAVRPPGL
jgi:hypothetical protein